MNKAWARLGRWAPWALAALVLVLLARQAHTIAWADVGRALAQQPRGDLLGAAALALASHALFASYDLIGRRLTGHGLSVRRTLRIAAICYAFNLNFGSLVGALALKLRLYVRAGLKPATVGRVIGYGIVTNWLGYGLVGGAVLLLAPLPLALPAAAPRALGALLLAAALGYLLLCARAKRRQWHWRGHALALPPLGIALWQAAVAAANWLLMGAIVWLLLQQRAPYAEVLAVLLAAAVAGVLTHVPAGLGVLEAVFVAALGARIEPALLLAALLAYRAAYYLLPLAGAVAGYAWTEWRPGHRAGRHAW